MYKGQNFEDMIIADAMGDQIKTLLECGSNDGITLSNSYYFIQQGCSAILVEPSPGAYKNLSKLHADNPKVKTIQCAIGDRNGESVFYDSGELLGTGDAALVSTCVKEETKRWASLNMPFEEMNVPMITFDTLLLMCPFKKFDFISIDCEGFDLCILKQIDLSKVECKCLCIEHNGNLEVLQEIMDYCSFYGLDKVLTQNQENIILAKS